jgi:large subunit ribosomal protein L33
LRAFSLWAGRRSSRDSREANGCPHRGIPNLIRRCRYMRVKITLRCNECKQRNYNTMKNKKNTPDKLELNKYCPFCRKHTVHTETK